MTPHSQIEKFAPRVGVFAIAGNVPVFYVHRAEARRMILDGQAERRCTGKTCREITLTATTANLRRSPCTPASVRDFAGHPTTYREHLMEPTDQGPVTVGVVIQFRRISKRDWPVYRAALIDCLPAGAKAEIREIFA